MLCRGATVYAASIAQPNIRRSLSGANLFAAAEACGICGCRKATVYLQIEYSQATWSALPRRNSICGKQSAAEYTQKPARCKLVCNCNGFSQMCVLQGTLISPNRYGQATGRVYAASRAQTNIRRSLCDANLFAPAMASCNCGCRKATVYLQMRYVRQRGVLCRGATVYAASIAQPNIRGHSGI